MRFPPSPSPPLPSRLAIYVAGIPVQTDSGPSSTYNSGAALQAGCASLGPWGCYPWYELHTLSQESCEADVCDGLCFALRASHGTAIKSKIPMVGYVAFGEPTWISLFIQTHGSRCLRHVTGGELLLSQLHVYCLSCYRIPCPRREPAIEYCRQGIRGVVKTAYDGAGEPGAMSSINIIVSRIGSKTRFLRYGISSGEI